MANLMPLHKTQPAAAAAIASTSRSPALPAAGGDTPLDTTVGGPAREEADEPTGVQVLKNETFDKTVCSSSRGLLDLVTNVNKPMTVYTRQCSVSLPLGLGILPYGSKLAADSRPPLFLHGQLLVEIFEVSANYPFVGTIWVIDAFSHKTIYHKDNWDTTYYDFCSRRTKWVSHGNAVVDFKYKMELIGPSRANTADGGFVMKFLTPATRKKDFKTDTLVLSTDDDISLYNQVKTHTWKTDRCHLYVTYSVLPDALSGFVKVLLQLPNHWRGVAGATIYGLVTARSEKFDIGSTLFSKDFNEAVAPPHDDLCSLQGYSCMMVPLTRSVLAVPVGEYLHINGKLRVCGYDALHITIDHRISIDCGDVNTPWIKGGESLTAVTIRLSPIF